MLVTVLQCNETLKYLLCFYLKKTCIKIKKEKILNYFNKENFTAVYENLPLVVL